MEVFNIISGICSIAGLMVSVFTAGKVIKVSNKIKGTTINGPYVGRDSINGIGYKEHQ